MTRTRYADACDNHVERVLAKPRSAIPNSDGGITATYRCPRCGRRWTCSWVIQPEAEPDETWEAAG